MVSGRIQATFYHNRRCTCLAGICIYMRIPNEPWFFGELPEELILDLMGPGVKRYTSPRGRHRRQPLPLFAPIRPSAPPIADVSSDEYSDEVDLRVEDTEAPPPYASVFGSVRMDFSSRIDEIPPPNYFSIFANSTKL